MSQNLFGRPQPYRPADGLRDAKFWKKPHLRELGLDRAVGQFTTGRLFGPIPLAGYRSRENHLREGVSSTEIGNTKPYGGRQE
jgi:hypothetical protein